MSISPQENSAAEALLKTTPTSTPVSTNSNTGSWYDKMNAVKLPNTTQNTQTQTNSTPTPTEPSLIDKIGNDIKTGADEYTKGENETNPSGIISPEGVKTATKGLLGTGLDVAGDTASEIYKPISAIIDKLTGGAFGKIASQTPTKGSLMDRLVNNPEVQKWAYENPNAGHHFASLLNLIPAVDEEGGGEIEPSTIVDRTKTQAENVSNIVTNKANEVKNNVKKIKLEIPTEDINTTVGKVAQGKTKDISTFKAGLTKGVIDESGNEVSKPLDTKGIKTYKELNTKANEKIGEVAKTQDSILSKDKTVHPLSDFEQSIGEGKNAVKINYVKQAIDNLKELYTNTSDIKGLAKINEIATKADSEGLMVKEVNDLARNYGSEFGSKAFGKINGEPLTSVNATKFENIRTGLKNTARDLLPDNTSRALDTHMSDLYKVKELSGKMAEKVNTAVQRLQSKNIAQKIGSTIGKIGKITGVGDIVKELTGLSNTPGASTMNAVEIEGKLANNLIRITEALNKDDAGFISSIKDIIQHPK